MLMRIDMSLIKSIQVKGIRTAYRSKKEGTGISNSFRPHLSVLTATSEGVI